MIDISMLLLSKKHDNSQSVLEDRRYSHSPEEPILLDKPDFSVCFSAYVLLEKVIPW